MNPNNNPAPSKPDNSPVKPMANQELAAQNLGNGLDSVNQTAASTLAGYNKSTQNIYFVSQPDTNTQMSLMNHAEIVTPPPKSQNTRPAIAGGPNMNPLDKSAYLDQIAAPPPKRNLFSRKIILILGGAIVAVFGAVAVIALINSGQTSNVSGEVLGQRLINLQSLLAYGQKNNAAGSNVNRVIAETNLVVISRVNDLDKFYSTSDKSTFRTPGEKVAAQYSDAQLIAKLDEAKANANLEPVLAAALENYLLEIGQYISTLRQDSNNQELRAALEKTYQNFAELRNRLTTN
jgi:hypothetical protein